MFISRLGGDLMSALWNFRGEILFERRILNDGVSLERLGTGWFIIWWMRGLLTLLRNESISDESDGETNEWFLLLLLRFPLL